jgi:hypothetical protein
VNISRWFLALIFLGLSSSIAMADGVDPTMGLQGGTDATGLFSPNDPNFAFTVLGSNFTQGSSEFFDFINATGQTAVGVNLLATLLPNTNTPTLTFTCAETNAYFNTCNVTTLANGQVQISYSNTGEGGLGGIPNDPNPSCNEGPTNCNPSVDAADFAVVVTDVHGDLAGLAPGQGFSVQGTLAVPEPSTVLLVLAGGILFLVFKRR